MRSTLPSLSLAHSHFSKVQETYFLSGLPSPGQPPPATNSNYKSWAARSAQTLSACASVPGTLSSLWQIPFAAPGGGGETTILSLSSGRLLPICKPFNIRTCPVLSFLLVSTYKEKNVHEKAPLLLPLPQNGTRKSTFTKLACWRTCAGHLCAASQPGADPEWAGPSPTPTLPAGVGPRGEGAPRDLGWNAARGGRTLQHLPPRPRLKPQMDHSPTK